MKVLIVEDDLMIADLLEESLIDAGFDVCGIARTVTMAVEMALRHRPNLAIVDITLADGERGTSIAGRLNASWPLSILFASGVGQADRLENCGGSAVITKPYQLSDMIVAISILDDIVVDGATTRLMPPGMRLLPQQAVVGVALH